MNISVVIPNYNGEKLLVQNLPFVIQYTGDAEIILVDNASTDASIETVKKVFPKIKIIQECSHQGFSTAVNKGVVEAKGDYILLLNTDVVPTKNFISPLLAHFSDPTVFAVGCLQKVTNNTQETEEGRGIGSFREGFLLHKGGKLAALPTLWVSGGAAMVRRELWHKLGGLESLYEPFYWEDIDLSYRAWKHGYKVLFEPKSVVLHKQSQGAIRSTYSPSHIRMIAYRNQILFVWLNITSLHFLFRHILFLPIHLIRSLFSFNWEFLHGFALALSNIWVVLQRRKDHVGEEKRSDQEVLELFSYEWQ